MKYILKDHAVEGQEEFSDREAAIRAGFDRWSDNAGEPETTEIVGDHSISLLRGGVAIPAYVVVEK